MLGQIMSEENMNKLIGSDGIIKEGRNEMIPIDKLSPCGFNTFSVEDIETLEREIKVAGLITPLTVIGPDEEGIYKILSGERRYNALKRIHAENESEYELINCYICGSYDMNHTAQKLIMEVANVSVRKINDTPHRFEIVKLLKELEESGYMNKWNIGTNLAQYLGVTKNYARFYKRVIYAENPQLEEMVEQKHIDIKLAAILTTFPKEEQIRFINRVKAGAKAWNLYKKEYQKKEIPKKTEAEETHCSHAEITDSGVKKDGSRETLDVPKQVPDMEEYKRVPIPQKENVEKKKKEPPKSDTVKAVKKVIPTFDSTVFSTEKMKDIFNDYTGSNFEEAIRVETHLHNPMSGEKKKESIDYYRLKNDLRFLMDKEETSLEDEEVIELCREIADKFEF